MIMIIIPSAATVATTEVDEVGNLLLLCSMLSRMAVLATQFPQRILLRTDGMTVLLAAKCSSSPAQAPKEDEEEGGKEKEGGGKGVGKDERRRK
jgi:hypothetical protein